MYVCGLSRVDTPPRDIPTLGAAGPKKPPSGLARMMLGERCPFHTEEDAQFPARRDCMSLDTLRPSDAPPGPLMFLKDYDRYLLTQDLPRAQPVLAHPASNGGLPVPWQQLEKPALAEIPKTRPKALFPKLDPARPRDLSLTTADIELARPGRIGTNCEGHERADRAVDPLVPNYQFAPSDAKPPPELGGTGRCSLDLSGIEGARPRPAVPARARYGDPLKCELEFRSREQQKEAAAASRAAARGAAAPAEPLRPTPRAAEPAAFPARPQRYGDPLAPRYRVPLPRSEPGTSLYCRWNEERGPHGPALPATESSEIGPVPGGRPSALVRDNGEPQLSLQTRDIAGASSAHRVGHLPYSMYGPFGLRPSQSSSLNTADVEGAQASSARRKPQRARLAVMGAAAVTGGSAATPRGEGGVPGGAGAAGGAGGAGAGVAEQGEGDAEPEPLQATLAPENDPAPTGPSSNS